MRVSLLSLAAGICLALTQISAFAEVTANQKKMAAYFTGKSEPTTKDAVWTSDQMFKVGVIDNGTNRDGYALYVCGVLNEYNMGGKYIQVQVIDIVKLKRQKKWVKLGKQRCG